MPGTSCSLVTQGHPVFLGFHPVIRETSWALEEIAYGDHTNYIIEILRTILRVFFEGKLENQLQRTAWVQFILFWGCVEMYQSKHRKESLTTASEGEWIWRFGPVSNQMFLHYLQWLLNMIVGPNFKWDIIHSCGRCGAENQIPPTFSIGTCSAITWVTNGLCLGKCSLLDFIKMGEWVYKNGWLYNNGCLGLSTNNFWESISGQILLGQKCRTAISAHPSGHTHSWAYSTFQLDPVPSSTCSTDPQHWDFWLRNRFLPILGRHVPYCCPPSPLMGLAHRATSVLQAGKLPMGHDGCLLAISKKAVSERKTGTVLFPQWNLFLACILVSGKIVLKIAINFNEKNLSTPSCVATVHQLTGSHETTETSVFSYFSEINLRFLFTKLQNNTC